MTTRPFAAVRGGGGGAWVRAKSVSGLLFLSTLSRFFFVKECTTLSALSLYSSAALSLY